MTTTSRHGSANYLAAGNPIATPVLASFAVGLVLLFAAMRGVQAIRSPTPAPRFWPFPGFLPVVVAWETFLGLWLITGTFAAAARRVAIGCFSAFACYTLFEALSGRTDCGCFGQVKVNPWFTVVLDVSIVLALLFLAKPAVKVFRKQQNLHFVSQDHPRRTYILWKPLFAGRSSGIGPDRVACGENLC